TCGRAPSVRTSAPCTNPVTAAPAFSPVQAALPSLPMPDESQVYPTYRRTSSQIHAHRVLPNSARATGGSVRRSTYCKRLSESITAISVAPLSLHSSHPRCRMFGRYTYNNTVCGGRFSIQHAGGAEKRREQQSGGHRVSYAEARRPPQKSGSALIKNNNAKDDGCA